MVRLSDKTRTLLKNDILAILYESSLKPMYTSHIATELRRDNEFVLKLLLELKKEKLVKEVKKGRSGDYLARKKWIIPSDVRQRMDVV